VTPLGRIRDSIPDRTANNHRDSIIIEIPGVDSASAVLLDLAIDGTVSGTADTVRYATPIHETTTVRFRITARALTTC
jgi:hypothetical protein